MPNAPTQENPIAAVGLSEETLAKIRELRQLCVDSSKGFEECAALIDRGEIQAAFRAIAAERAELATVLASQISWNDSPEPEPGSYLAAMHRAWIAVREACSSDSLGVVLSEAERGEDEIKHAFEGALKQTVNSPIHDVLARQYDSVKRTHDAVRDFRDAHNS